MTSFVLMLLPLLSCVRASAEDTLAADDTIPFALEQLRIAGAQKYCTVSRDPRTNRNVLRFGLRGMLDGASFDIAGRDSGRIEAQVVIPREWQIKQPPGKTVADSWWLRCEIERSTPGHPDSQLGKSCQLDRSEFHLTRSRRGTSIQFTRVGDPPLGVTERVDFQPAMSSFDRNRFDEPRADSVLTQLRAGSAVELTLAAGPGEKVTMSLLSLKSFPAAYDLMELVFAVIDLK